jgi:hypothetical protein
VVGDNCRCGDASSFWCDCGQGLCRWHTVGTVVHTNTAHSWQVNPTGIKAAELWSEFPPQMCADCHTRERSDVAARLAAWSSLSDEALTIELLLAQMWTNRADQNTDGSFGAEVMSARGAQDSWVCRDPLDTAASVLAASATPPALPILHRTPRQQEGPGADELVRTADAAAWVFTQSPADSSATTFVVGALGGNERLRSPFAVMRRVSQADDRDGLCFVSAREAESMRRLLKSPPPPGREPRVFAEDLATVVAQHLVDQAGIEER